MNRFVLGTRGSPLALAQTELTRQELERHFPDLQLEVKTFTTRGDQKLDLSLLKKSEAGGKGLFTKELEDALMEGTIDVAIHSAKDLPGHNPEGLDLVAVLERASTADVLITREAADFDALPSGALVGTSSIRRARQVLWLRGDLAIEDWRGNVQTRLRKLGQSGRAAGIILAAAGLERLGFDLSHGVLEFEEYGFRVSSLADKLLPAIGQGAIALQASTTRPEVHAVLRAINHAPTWVCLRAERELQLLLSGDCSLPVGAQAQVVGQTVTLRAILFGPEGQAPARAQASGSCDEPRAIAQQVFALLQKP